MKFVNENATIFVPDGEKEEKALERTTHLAISAHQDDIELMAYHGVLQCFGKKDAWFTGVVPPTVRAARETVYIKIIPTKK